MTTDKDLLTIISNETKSSTDHMSVVTPSIYASMFKKYAKEHGEDLKGEEDVSINLIKQECNTLTDMQKQTSKNANALSKSTTQAIKAIKEKDENTLKKVLSETNQLRKELDRLKEAVYKDELTHAYNRRWFNENYLEDTTNNFTHNGVLVMIDLNFFKQINDTHGHIVGDKVLVYITNELKKINSKVVRYGGDEFILVCQKETNLNKAIELLNKVRDVIISKKLKTKDNKFTVSFSLGGTNFKEGDEFSSIIELADKYMYDDKIQIKKRVSSI